MLDSILQMFGMDLEKYSVLAAGSEHQYLSLAATSVWEVSGANMSTVSGAAMMSVDTDLYESGFPGRDQ